MIVRQWEWFCDDRGSAVTLSLSHRVHLKDKIKGMYKPKVNVHFVKNIKIADKDYSLFATVEYEIGSSREPDTLHNGILTRMWIKENV